MLPRPSTGTTQRASTSGTAATSTAMTTSQPPTSAAAATRLRPLANSTRDSAADSPKPTSPGANAMKVSASWRTCSGCDTNSRAAGQAAPASSAAPSQETSIAARTAPAAVRSNSPSGRRGQQREHAGRDGHRQHRVRHEEHLPAVVVEHHGTCALVPVGQHDDHHQGGVLGDERGDADGGQRPDPPRHARRKPQGGPQPQPQPQRRAKCGEHEGGDACRGAHREHQFGRQGQAGEAATVPGGQRDEGKVGADHHHAGHDGGQRRAR